MGHSHRRVRRGRARRRSGSGDRRLGGAAVGARRGPLARPRRGCRRLRLAALARAPAGRDRCRTRSAPRHPRRASRVLAALRRPRRRRAARLAPGAPRAAALLGRGARRMTIGRAPGKLLLLGEHSVVYGYPALAAAIPRHVTVELEPAAETRVELPGGIQTPFPLLEAVIAMARDAGFPGMFHARVQSDIPLGSGLGSSAALGVALARALKPGCAPDEAAAMAMRIERVLHGAPSGVDPAACAREGVIFFTRGEPPVVESVEGRAFIAVCLTGIARGTHSTVLPLAERRKSDPRIEPLLGRLGTLAREGRQLFERGDFVQLGARFDAAHAALRDLGVSCAELEEAVAALRRAGALGAKLTGAGGGGAAIGLARDEAHARQIAARTGGFAVKVPA